MKVICNIHSPPIGGALVAEYVKSVHSKPIEVIWSDKSVIEINKIVIPCSNSNDIARFIAREFPDCQLYGSTFIEKTEVDHWLTYSIGLLNSKYEFDDALCYLSNALAPVTYFVGTRITIADFAVFGGLYANKQWHTLSSNSCAPFHLLRWYDFIKVQEGVTKVLDVIPIHKIKSKPAPRSSIKGLPKTIRAQEGKFIDLPGAEMGKVVVRFPPEASGYLHIGHAKAALLNQYYQQAFQGKLIMRFDDTNPAKENVHFEKVILEDLEMLEIEPDFFTHTSQYFHIMLEYCEQLLKDGKAYVDDTDPELMKQQREQRIESENRNNSYEKNIQLWNEMVNGTEIGQRCCVRAKINMQSLNGCMRDPTIYRFKNEPHPRTGNQYKVYPTYDFACPIVDAIENVTHTLRTMEYHDRDDQFYWFIEALGLRRPYIWEYSRLSMTNTVLSKRKLAWFVENKLVDGWDDPRFPTVRGVLRRGMTVEGLKQFIIAQGSSRSVVFMEWDKIWAFNKKVIDPIAPRFTAIEYSSHVPVFVKGAQEEKLIVDKHPKNRDVGEKEVWVGPKILIDYADAEQLKEDENTTFINWGNLLIKNINRENGVIVSVEAEPNLDNKDYKKTLKLTWLGDTDYAELTPTWCVYFDHIISKPLLGKDEDFKKYVGHETKKQIQMLGEPEMKNLKKGDIIQLQRRGFFKVDVAYKPLSLYTCKEGAIVLFAIPDGHTKESSAAGISKVSNEQINTSATAIDILTEISAASLNQSIIKQGNIVKNLKARKTAKNEIDSALKILLELETQYKKLRNPDRVPGCVPSEDSNEGTSNDLNSQIIVQGNKVRQLKIDKASKDVINAEVKLLLELKSEYKKSTGLDWKLDETPSKASQTSSTTDEKSILDKISAQGDKVRDLKLKKADKSSIDVEVKNLLKLKAEYKDLTGTDWKPGTVPRACKSMEVPETPSNSDSEVVLFKQIIDQGNKVRQLKAADKVDRSVMDREVQDLLKLKTEYKVLTGKDWSPEMAAQPSAEHSVKIIHDDEAKNSKETITVLINQQGEIVRNMKSSAAPKEELESAIKKLLDLKAEYKCITGTDFPSVKVSSKTSKSKGEKVSKQKSEKDKKTVIVDDSSNVKKQTRLGLEVTKEENLPEWYSQVITKGELIEYYDVSGCYILRPWSYSIWEAIKDWFDGEIKKLGVQNCYFPLFVSRAALEKEKSHIEDFSPEVAWVTKSGNSDMAEPVAVRPTSETAMYPAYAKWIQSYRDLPIKLNQWNNVVRWEFKHPQPFLRTREFLWQEGHTAYANKDEAEEEVKIILDLYAKIYTDLLAIPVIKGRKTDKEKFAGGDYTLTIEGYVSASGRGIQAATSHFLGQNFSKMFEIIYDDPETQEKKFVYQNSWGITTRTIGVMVMVHADNQGLIIPPRVAAVQIIIVPCGVTVGLSEEDKADLQLNCSLLENDLNEANVRVKGDYRINYSPGWKFNHWELKGVPIRVELGPKDIKNKQIVAVRRDTGQKIMFKRDTAVKDLVTLLENIQQHLFNKASEDFSKHTVQLTDWSQFTPTLDNKNVILAPFCGEGNCEDKIKADSARDASEIVEAGAPSMGAKSLCIPLEQPPMKSNAKCIHPECKNKPKFYTLFGRSY